MKNSLENDMKIDIYDAQVEIMYYGDSFQNTILLQEKKNGSNFFQLMVHMIGM